MTNIVPILFSTVYDTTYFDQEDVDQFHRDNHSPYYDDFFTYKVDTDHPDFPFDYNKEITEDMKAALTVAYCSNNVKPNWVV